MHNPSHVPTRGSLREPAKRSPSCSSILRELRGSGLWPKYQLLNLGEAVRQFDRRAPRVGDEGDCGVERGDPAVGDGELDALRLELFAELLEVLHLEADVVIDAACGWRDGCGRWREVQCDAGQ